MTCGAVKADHGLKKATVLGAGDKLIHRARVAKRQFDAGNFDDASKFVGVQLRHRIDGDAADLGNGQPARDHGRIIG